MENSFTWPSVVRNFWETTNTGAKWRRVNGACTFDWNRRIVFTWTRYIRFRFIFESL